MLESTRQHIILTWQSKEAGFAIHSTYCRRPTHVDVVALRKAPFFGLQLLRHLNPTEMLAVTFNLLLKPRQQEDGNRLEVMVATPYSCLLPVNPIPICQLLHTNGTFILQLGRGQQDFLCAVQLHLNAHAMLQVLLDVALQIRK
jgi:hypothetical protein